jgi:hypothetical protein
MGGAHSSNLVFEGDAFLVVFHEPSFRGIFARKDLEMVDVADILAGVDIDQHGLLVSLQLALSPMMRLAVRIELANVVAVQGPHDADAREHRRSATRRFVEKSFPARAANDASPFCRMAS